MTEQKNGEKSVNVRIETTQGPWETTFLKTVKIQEVIQAIIQNFNFASNGKYELRLQNNPDTALKPERPLVSYGIENDTVIVFTDLGVAV